MAKPSHLHRAAGDRDAYFKASALSQPEPQPQQLYLSPHVTCHATSTLHICCCRSYTTGVLNSLPQTWGSSLSSPLGQDRQGGSWESHSTQSGKPTQKQKHTWSTYSQGRKGRATANSPSCKERTPGKAEGGNRGRNVKGPFFPKMGFLPRGLDLSACAGLKRFVSNAILSKRTSGLDSTVWEQRSCVRENFEAVFRSRHTNMMEMPIMDHNCKICILEDWHILHQWFSVVW